MPMIDLTTDAWSLVTLTTDEIWEARGGALRTSIEPILSDDQGLTLEQDTQKVFRAGQKVRFRRIDGRLTTLVREAAPFAALAGYDQVEDVLKVSGIQAKFRDSFEGAGVDATKWESAVGAGGSIAVSGGALVMGSGTTANSESYVLSKAIFTVPFLAQVGVTLSQRIANQTFFVEAVSVDPATGVPDGKSVIALMFDGTTATQAKYRVGCGGATPLDSAAVTFPTSAGGSYYELEPSPGDAKIHGSTTDGVAVRANSYRRHLKIPDPTASYKLRLRWLNGATAPASNTTATITFASAFDHTELQVEVVGGRGQAMAGEALPCQVLNSPSVTLSGTGNAVNANDNLFFNDSTTAQGAGATLTGTSRDVGSAAGSNHRYSAFNVFVLSDQPGTLRIECSNDGTTWRRATADAAVAANTPVYLRVPVMTRYYRPVYVNGATAQGTFMANSSYTAA